MNKKIQNACRILGLVTAGALMSACGGGSDGGGDLLRGCAPISGGGTSTAQTVTPGCVGCSVASPNAAIDGNGGSFANLQMPANSGGSVALRAVSQNGVVFPSGTVTGFVHSISYGDSAALVISLNTYLMGALQEQFNFNSGSGSSTMDPGNPGRASFGTQMQFDAVELNFTRSGGTGEVNARVHEFCAN
ncbi:hypothetical protein GYB61_08700 [bacterium]|nr:hypothetical protein [bacterium]